MKTAGIPFRAAEKAKPAGVHFFSKIRRTSSRIQR